MTFPFEEVKDFIGIGMADGDCIVCWRSQEEWDHVATLLQSGSLTDLEEALSWISVWKSRLRRLPMAINATHDLFGPYVADLRMTCQPADSRCVFDLNNLVACYCCGITRFVNSINELGQRGDTIQPIHIVVEKLGLPRWVVELRHKATHQELPSLSQLRHAGEFCRKWILAHYWQRSTAPASLPLRNRDDAIDVDVPSDGEKQLSEDSSCKAKSIRKLLRRYLRCSEKLVQNQSISNKTPGKLRHALNDCLKSIRSHFDCSASLVLDELVSEGCLLLGPQQIDAMNVQEKSGFPVPAEQLELWEPFLDTIKVAKLGNWLVGEIAKRIAEAQNGATPSKVAQMLGWLSYFADVAQRSDDYSIDWRAILSTVLHHPTQFSWHLTRKIMRLSVPPIDKRAEKQLKCLRQMLLRGEIANSELECDDELMMDDDWEFKILSAPSGSGDCRNDGIDWSSVPFGHVFGRDSKKVNALLLPSQPHQN